MAGCAAFTADRDRVAKITTRNVALQKENESLKEQLERQKVVNARLQMAMVQQKEDVTRQIQASQKEPVKELADTVIRTPASNTRVKTVAYLAEITTEVESAKAISKPEEQEVFVKAEDLLAKSNRELEEEQYEQASHSATQALEAINTKESGNIVGETRISTEKYSDFIDSFVMKVAGKSNVRKNPGMQGRVMTILPSQSTVRALGHKGRWIKIALQDGRQGWIYYSLLSIPELPDNVEVK